MSGTAIRGVSISGPFRPLVGPNQGPTYGQQQPSPSVNRGTMPPARSQSDSKASLRVLAADKVVWTGGNIRGIGGGLEYRINHPSRKNPKRPDFQNILFADGHVEGRGSEYYVADPDASNWSATHDAARTRFYWNGSGPAGTSGPPGQPW